MGLSGVVADQPGPPSPDVRIADVLAEVPAPVAFLPLGTFPAVYSFSWSLVFTHWFASCPPPLTLSFPFAPSLATSIPFHAPFIPLHPFSPASFIRAFTSSWLIPVHTKCLSVPLFHSVVYRSHCVGCRSTMNTTAVSIVPTSPSFSPVMLPTGTSCEDRTKHRS
jgi:hypothetical protein